MIPEQERWCRCVWDYARTPEGRWALFGAVENPSGPKFRLLTAETRKSVPALRMDVRIATLFLSPAGFGEGPDVCAYRQLPDQFVRKEYRRGGRLYHRRPDCSQICLAEFAGQLRMPASMRAKLARRRLYFQDRDRFMRLLRQDITTLLRYTQREGTYPAVRLNGGSDLAWPINPEGRALMGDFPDLQFYDYTKSVQLVRAYRDRRTPRNWHVTWSWPGAHVLPSITREMLAATGVAVVFPVLPKKAGVRDPEPLPPAWRPPGLRQEYRVEDGDLHDARWIDARPGVVIGLRAKGEGTWYVRTEHGTKKVMGLQRQVLDLPPAERTIFLARLTDRQERALARARKAGAFRRKGRDWETRGRVAARLDAIRGAFVGERLSWSEAIRGQAPAEVMAWLVAQLAEAVGARSRPSSPGHVELDWSEARKEKGAWKTIWPEGPPSYTLRVGPRSIEMQRRRRKRWERYPLNHAQVVQDILRRISRAYPGLEPEAENPELMVLNPQERSVRTYHELSRLPAVKQGRLAIVRDIYRLQAAGKPLNTSRDVVQVYDLLLRRRQVPADREAFVVVATDTKRQPIGVFVASVGARDMSSVDRSVIAQALAVTGATWWFVAHNHPTGDPDPSREDYAVTEALARLGALIGAGLVDHVVVGTQAGRVKSYRSIRDVRPDLFPEMRFLGPQGSAESSESNPYPVARTGSEYVSMAQARRPARDAFREFHGVDPARLRRVPRMDTGDEAVALGRAVEVRYQPAEGERAGVLWYHRFGPDVQLAASADGRFLFFAPKKRKKMVDWQRGIVG